MIVVDTLADDFPQHIDMAGRAIGAMLVERLAGCGVLRTEVTPAREILAAKFFADFIDGRRPPIVERSARISMDPAFETHYSVSRRVVAKHADITGISKPRWPRAIHPLQSVHLARPGLKIESFTAAELKANRAHHDASSENGQSTVTKSALSFASIMVTQPMQSIPVRPGS